MFQKEPPPQQGCVLHPLPRVQCSALGPVEVVAQAAVTHKYFLFSEISLFNLLFCHFFPLGNVSHCLSF